MNYLGGDMPVFQIKFSRPAGEVVTQYYNFLRLGFEGYKAIHDASSAVCQYASEIVKLGPFELLCDSNPVTGVPTVTWRIREGEAPGYTLFDLADRLRARAWQVPASTLTGTASDIPVQHGGVGPFVTFVLRERSDGLVARWESRRYRKHPKDTSTIGSMWWAPRSRGWWIAVLFAIGSLLFALGVVPAFVSAVGTRWDAATFFVGSMFFTAAGFLTYREAVDAGPVPAGAKPRRFFVFQPERIDWWATAVQIVANLIGSVAFGVSAAAWYLNPVTGQVRNADRSSLGTFVRAVCVLVGALLLLPERTEGVT